LICPYYWNVAEAEPVARINPDIETRIRIGTGKPGGTEKLTVAFPMERLQH
jgi:hypothetical protein